MSAGAGYALRLVDPATLALHEVAEPARLRALVRQLRASGVQDSPVLVTEDRHGLLVLDGVHRTKALLSLGVPRLLAAVVPRAEVADPESWTHELAVPDGPDRLLEALHASPALDLGAEGDGRPGRVVARAVTEGQVRLARAAQPGGGALSRAYHAVAEAYAGLVYTRRAGPPRPGPGELQVRWVAPTLAELEALVDRHGALPAGVTRFPVPDEPGRLRVSFADLRAAVDGDAAERVLTRVATP